MFTGSDIRQFIVVISALAENRAIHQELANRAIQAITREDEATLLTRLEAASILKCSVKTIDRLCDEGKLSRIQCGKRSVRIRLADLKAMSGL